MYYVVYIINHDTFAVIPENWLRSFDEQIEKFLNNGLNSNQKHVCFWTNSVRARDVNGVIKLDFEPNFNAGFHNNFPAEGCYLCKIIKAKVNFVEAELLRNKKRFPPAIYNPKRLFERPIPHVPKNLAKNSKKNATSVTARAIVRRRSYPIIAEKSKRTFISNEATSEATSNPSTGPETYQPMLHNLAHTNPSSGLVQSPTIELQRETLSCTSNEHITHCSPGTSQHDTGATTRVKNENLSSSLHGFYDSNASEITSLLHQPQLEPQPTPQLEPQTHVYEDIEMTFVQFPMPLPPPAEPVLQKRENDAFSGDMAFGEYENGRVYLIGNEFFEIQYSVIRQLIDWNTNAPDNISTDIDKRFVQAILLILLPREQLAENNIPECVLDFVERLFFHRTNGDNSRVSSIHGYIEQFCLQKRKELRGESHDT